MRDGRDEDEVGSEGRGAAEGVELGVLVEQVLDGIGRLGVDIARGDSGADNS